MKTTSQWGQSLVMLCSVMITAGSFAPAASANQPQIQSPVEVAQAGMCRRVTVKQGLTVRDAATLNSRVVGGVEYNRQVTLAEGAKMINGPDGRVWVEISGPVRGFVSAGYPNNLNNLVNCDGSAMNTSQANPAKPAPAQPAAAGTNLCRQVDRRAAPQGLLIRADATPASALRGSVAAGAKVTLISGYKVVPDKSGARRNWVEISAPTAGFVSANSLVMCK